MKFAGGALQKRLSEALEAFSDRPEEKVLHILALRSMAQAKYSPGNIGHFGLGFADYTHFTSPIRRYPDLIVHRLIKGLLIPERGYKLMTDDELTGVGNFLSACEQRAVKAERFFNSVKKARFMSKKVGEEFDGVISSVTKFGVFVVLNQFDVDGLVRVEELGNEYFEFNEDELILVGKKTRKVYRIGDPLRILVARADTEAGQIDFVLTPEAKKSQTPSGRAPNKGHKEGYRGDGSSRDGARNRAGNESLRREGKKKDKRSKAKDDRGGVRKARVSKSRGKGKARSVSSRKNSHSR